MFFNLQLGKIGILPHILTEKVTISVEMVGISSVARIFIRFSIAEVGCKVRSFDKPHYPLS